MFSSLPSTLASSHSCMNPSPTQVSVTNISSYFFYPETRRRSLEEIDFIFAKGFEEKISYVKAAKELPLLSPDEVEDYAIRYGFVLGNGLEKPVDFVDDEHKMA